MSLLTPKDQNKLNLFKDLNKKLQENIRSSSTTGIEPIDLTTTSDEDSTPSSKVRKLRHSSTPSSATSIRASSNATTVSHTLVSVVIPHRPSKHDVNLPAHRENRAKFLERLATIQGPSVTLVNNIDGLSPPVDFEFINDYVLGFGVERLGKEFQSGCDCRKDNGRHIGCEHRSCQCLEETARNSNGRSVGFPYYAVPERWGCLREIYLDTRYAIYECNELCNCPPNCKNKVVQHGRNVPLEIFKTETRGWGLRCPVPLQKGQFVDTYRGEVISDAEATRREQRNAVGKDSYLYSLDKFQGNLGDEDYIPDEELYVVDGEFMGGPTRFMNHSCDPNCRQFTASLVRGDSKVYELPFFALDDIPAGTELTFNYTDNEEDEPVNEKDVLKLAKAKGKIPTRCLCGEANCKKFLWL